MASESIPVKDLAYKAWSKNLATVASANASTLNLTLPQVAAIVTSVDAFGDAVTQTENAKAAVKGCVATKKAARKSNEALIRPYAKQWLANPAIPNNLKAQLGLTPGVTPGGTVNVPLNVAASADANGKNTISWKRNGNAGGTVFIVEAKVGNAADFTMIAVTSKSKYVHAGQTPGVQVVYRVTAQRGSMEAGPSNPAIVYPGQGMDSAFLKVAA